MRLTFGTVVGITGLGLSPRSTPDSGFLLICSLRGSSDDSGPATPAAGLESAAGCTEGVNQEMKGTIRDRDLK